MDYKYDVFIAYSHEDAESADKVEEYLKKIGLLCWRYETSQPETQKVFDNIAQAIIQSIMVLALVSENSVNSLFFERELSYSHGNKKKIVPFLLHTTEGLPHWFEFIFAGCISINASPSLEDTLPRLAEVIMKIVDPIRHREAYEAENEVLRICHKKRKDFRFANNTQGILLQRNDFGFIKLVGGTLEMVTKENTFLRPMMEKLPQLTEFIVECHLKKEEGYNNHWFGLSFGEAHPKNYYEILINGESNLRITKYYENEKEPIASHQHVHHLKPGNTENHLKVIRKDSTWHVFANGFHALSVIDFDIRSGKLGFVVGPNLRVSFGDAFQISKVRLDEVYKEAMGHWERLETREARKLFGYIAQYDQFYKHPQYPLNVANILEHNHPDYRTSAIIVVGHKVSAQFHDLAAAIRLQEEINHRGKQRRSDLCWAGVATDRGILENAIFLKCPLIAVGGPQANQLTARFIREKLPHDSRSSDDICIQHDLAGEKRQVALWGKEFQETARAVDLFIESGLLQEFLNRIWTE